LIDIGDEEKGAKGRDQVQGALLIMKDSHHHLFLGVEYD